VTHEPPPIIPLAQLREAFRCTYVATAAGTYAAEAIGRPCMTYRPEQVRLLIDMADAFGMDLRVVAAIQAQRSARGTPKPERRPLLFAVPDVRDWPDDPDGAA
jgi:hypothetical protein